MRLLLLVNILAAFAADLLPDFHFSGAEKDRSHLRAVVRRTKGGGRVAHGLISPTFIRFKHGFIGQLFGDQEGPSKTTDQIGQDHFQLGLAIGRQYHEAIKARVAAHAPWKA